MSYLAQVFKVFIASPSDVAIERNLVREVLAEWNEVNSSTRSLVVLPIGCQTHCAPEMVATPQDIVNKRILNDADILIGVFWTSTRFAK